MTRYSLYELQLKNAACLLTVHHAEAKTKNASVFIQLTSGEISRQELKPKYRHYFWQLKLGGGLWLEIPESKAAGEEVFEKWVKTVFETVGDLLRAGDSGQTPYSLKINRLGDTDLLFPGHFDLQDQTRQFETKFEIKSYIPETGAPPQTAGSNENIVVPKPANTGYVEREVFFGTNRRYYSDTETLQFSPKRNERNLLGRCTVSIPETHLTGDTERPSWWQKIIGVKPTPSKHLTILESELLDRDQFLAQLHPAGSTANDMLLFVHGYNVEFEEAILRAAQLAWDLNFEGPALAYSWPSQGSIEGYFADEAAAEYSRPHFMEFLQTLLSGNSTGKVYIIAHSMGSRVVSRALEKMHDTGISFGHRISQLIFAAPDMDAAVFREQISPAFAQLQQITLYASDNDLALQASQKLRSDYPRAGQAGSNICIIAKVDTIDASDVRTDFLGHGYFAATLPLLNDIHSVIFHAHKPEGRMLKQVAAGGLKYWRFAK
ncbi:MAG: alpha/beta fold hydrolase [Bacteroidia bacterium]|jgi:esterase/lipase superfamily enzyme|nr:alpha/beta fold hydrolase [Bacteroidia bacterium]